jgi:aerobic-type carbon monoxide dehydrogenase small subunit (CoxS/CutS family)
MKLTLTLDGVVRHAEIDPGECVMDVLRRLGATSVKNGCDRGDCGSCAILVDGKAVNACLVFAAQVDGAQIRTVESLEGPSGLHPLQFTALDAGAVQCGFCTPGMLMTALDLLAVDADPTEHEVRRALAGSYCRCTGYTKPVAAILSAAALLREARRD